MEIPDNVVEALAQFLAQQPATQLYVALGQAIRAAQAKPDPAPSPDAAG